MKKKLLILCVSIIGLFFLWTGFLWKKFSCGIAGSYPCVETWNLKIKEADLIEVIKEIKKEHPELEPPNVSFAADERNSYWYDITFYYSDTKEDVFAWIRQSSDSSMTTLAFVALATHFDSLTPISETKMDNREINRDFGYFSNRKEIRKFENTILKLIEEKISNPSRTKSTATTKHVIPEPSDTVFVVIKDSTNPKAFDLSPDEIKEVNAIFSQCVADNRERLLSAQFYKRQYFPSINSKGEKEVWVNCFAEDWGKDWKREAVIVMDGGKFFFNFKINLRTKKYHHLWINCEA